MGVKLLVKPTEIRDQQIDAALSLICQARQQDHAQVREILSGPCKYQPGTVDKVAVMAMRWHIGLPMFVEGDAVEPRGDLGRDVIKAVDVRKRMRCA